MANTVPLPRPSVSLPQIVSACSRNSSSASTQRTVGSARPANNRIWRFRLALQRFGSHSRTKPSGSVDHRSVPEPASKENRAVGMRYSGGTPTRTSVMHSGATSMLRLTSTWVSGSAATTCITCRPWVKRTGWERSPTRTVPGAVSEV